MTYTSENEALEKSIAERHNRILSSITHDLKSPINAIITMTELIEEKLKNKPEIADINKFVKLISKAGGESLALVQEILTMAKMEAGREDFEPEVVEDLAKELAEVTNTFRYEASAKEIKLAIDIKTSLPVVNWDMRRIRLHALNNLVSNALKFTPAGGTVQVFVKAEQDTVIIKVEDDGPGISEGERDRVFQRFEQLDLKSERVSSGSGLGLYNARLIVERHGGKIYATDSSDYKGTAFVILLPVSGK